MTMKQTTYLFAATLMAGLFISGCGRQPGHETERVNDQMEENSKEMSNADDREEWMEERREASRELGELREKLVDRKMKEEERLADGIKDAERRAECERHIAELKSNIERIDTHMRTMDNSANTDWQRVKAEGRALADTTSNWFERQFEKVDYKTKADADNDGH